MYKITKEQLEFVLNTLMQFPARNSINAIDILRNLKPEEKEENGFIKDNQ